LLRAGVRTKRGNKNVAFIALNDGSTIHNLQLVIDPNAFSEELLKSISTGACIRAKGALVESKGSGQATEMQVEELLVYGEADPETYPLQKKGHTLEFLREIAHLRPRTNTFGAVLRIRHHLAFAIHKYFNGPRLLLPPLAYHHRFRCRGCRRDVSCNEFRSQRSSTYSRRSYRLRPGLLRKGNEPYCFRTIRGRTRSDGIGKSVHFRTDIQSGKFQYNRDISPNSG
jgi:hypothetical protein